MAERKKVITCYGDHEITAKKSLKKANLVNIFKKNNCCPYWSLI